MSIISNAHEVTIIAEDNPPYQYQMAGSEEAKGVSGFIVRELLKDLNHIDNIKFLPWSEGYEKTLNEDNYALFSTIRNTQREDLFKWVGPILSNNQYFLKLSSLSATINSIDDIKNTSLKIGVGKNQASQILLQAKGFENLVEYETLDEVRDAFLNGEVDLIVESKLSLYFYYLPDTSIFVENTNIQISNQDMYIAFSKNRSDEELAKWQNALDIMKESLEYDKIYKDALIETFKDAKILSDGHITTPEEYRETDTIKAKAGWNLLGSSNYIEDINILTSSGCVDNIWIYDNNKWFSLESGLSSIGQNNGFWLKSNQECDLKLNK
jgi:polar amino acid transport system substrate-binding protein